MPTTRENGTYRPMSVMARVCRFGQMAACTKDTGEQIRQMAEEDSYMLTETCMKAIGRMTRLMASESIITRMEPGMRGTGGRTSSMDMGKKHGRMVHAMRENIRMERRTAMESSTGPTVPPIKDSSLITIYTVLVSTLGLMEGNTTVIG